MQIPKIDLLSILIFSSWHNFVSNSDFHSCSVVTHCTKFDWCQQLSNGMCGISMHTLSGKHLQASLNHVQLQHINLILLTSKPFLCAMVNQFATLLMQWNKTRKVYFSYLFCCPSLWNSTIWSWNYFTEPPWKLVSLWKLSIQHLSILQICPPSTA